MLRNVTAVEYNIIVYKSGYMMKLGDYMARIAIALVNAKLCSWWNREHRNTVLIKLN
jgi:hypothetical protein